MPLDQPHGSIPLTQDDPEVLKSWIKSQALALGFSDCVIAKPDAQDQMPRFKEYLKRGYHADMHYLAENLDKRADPTLLVPGTKSIICVRMNYLVESPKPRYVPDQPNSAIIARYARGRDYHKVMRGRLKTLAGIIKARVGEFESRPFADSAPIFEKSLAESAGMGWTGKHTLLIHKKSGSFFVLGELFTSLELPFDQPATAHCGSCTACIDICPTQAIVEPYMLDARKCIAYLTIENKVSVLRNVLVGATMVVAASSAFAHVKLESATPAINASVASQPQNITLNFGEEVMLMNVKLLDGQRKDIPLNYKITHDMKKSFEVAVPKLKKGKYTVVWITMGADGHNMNGEYNFTLKAAK
nr:tRNA epoxyqueuosine(34) reductase QueG [Acinetobacter soli]